MRLAQLIRALHAAGPDPVRTGEAPHPSVEQRLLVEIVGALPQADDAIDAAAREGIRRGWRARHDLQRCQEEARSR